MKNVTIALIAITLTSVLSNAGELTFMTSAGETSLKDNSKIESVNTIIENTFDNVGKNIHSGITLAIKDEKGRVCYLSNILLPGADPVALAFNLKNSSCLLTCKIDRQNFPLNNEGNSANAAWISVK